MKAPQCKAGFAGMGGITNFGVGLCPFNQTNGPPKCATLINKVRLAICSRQNARHLPTGRHVQLFCGHPMCHMTEKSLHVE